MGRGGEGGRVTGRERRGGERGRGGEVERGRGGGGEWERERGEGGRRRRGKGEGGEEETKDIHGGRGGAGAGGSGSGGADARHPTLTQMSATSAALMGCVMRLPWSNTSALFPPGSSIKQGLTLVHLSAQLERFVWDGGYA